MVAKGDFFFQRKKTKLKCKIEFNKKKLPVFDHIETRDGSIRRAFRHLPERKNDSIDPLFLLLDLMTFILLRLGVEFLHPALNIHGLLSVSTLGFT